MNSSTARVLLTVALCFGILIVWQHFFAPKMPSTAKGPAVHSDAASNKQTKTKKADDGAASAKADATGERNEGAIEAAEAGAPGAGPVVSERDARLTTVEWKRRDGSRALVRFSERGAVLRSVELLSERFKEQRDGKMRPIDLVQQKHGPWPLQTRFPDSDIKLPENARFELEGQSTGKLRYVWRSETAEVSKTFTLDPVRPVIWMQVAVKNRTAKELRQRLQIQLFGEQDPHTGKAGMTNPYPHVAAGLCRVNGELQRRSVQGLKGESGGCSPAAGCGGQTGPVNDVGRVSWIGSDSRYFLVAVVPRGSSEQSARCEINAQAGERGGVDVSLLLPETRVDPQATVAQRFEVFAGAKDLNELDSVKQADGSSAELSESIEFGWFALLCRPMLAMLKLFYRLLGNWGLAIIVLTVLVKLATLYWSTKSMRSMAEMQRLKPKIDGLREKYGEDKTRLNQEMMTLYKQHKVNPMGGCLPMLIQMPVWFALYRTLGNAQELYHSGFFGWITDLTAPDPYYVLPIAMGISMFVQQAITPQPMEAAQAKMMKYMMPGIFTVMMLWLPAGLNLYIFVNTVLTAVHQWYMNRSHRGPDAPVAVATSGTNKVAAGSKGGGNSGAAGRRRQRTKSGAGKSGIGKGR